MKYVSNCPNCGAPLKGYGRCEYCGTVVDQPVQMLAIRPGFHKLECRTKVDVDPSAAEKSDVIAAYAMRDTTWKMAEALADAIKFTVKKDYDPRLCEEVILVRGELWVADPDVCY